MEGVKTIHNQEAEAEEALVEEEEDKEKETVSTTIIFKELTKEMLNATPAKSLATTIMSAKVMCSVTIAKSMGIMPMSVEERNQ